MVALTRFTVTINGSSNWCDSSAADHLAEVTARYLGEAAQNIADAAPLIFYPTPAHVRVEVAEDLGVAARVCVVVATREVVPA